MLKHPCLKPIYRYFLQTFYFREVSGFSGWQAPFIAQPAQPQPQDDLPFLLPRTMLTMAAATMMIKTVQIMIVAIFSMIHASIIIPPIVYIIPILHDSHRFIGLPCNVFYFAIFNFMFVVSFVASL